MIILDGVPFDRVSGISLVHGPDGEPVLIRPWQGHPNPRGRALHKHADGPCARLVLDALPRARGVYAIAGDTGFVWYVGRARDSIAARWGRPGRVPEHQRRQVLSGRPAAHLQDQRPHHRHGHGRHRPVAVRAPDGG